MLCGIGTAKDKIWSNYSKTCRRGWEKRKRNSPSGQVSSEGLDKALPSTPLDSVLRFFERQRIDRKYKLDPLWCIGLNYGYIFLEGVKTPQLGTSLQNRVNRPLKSKACLHQMVLSLVSRHTKYRVSQELCLPKQTYEAKLWKHTHITSVLVYRFWYTL